MPKNTRPIAIGPRKDGWPGENKILFKSNDNLEELTIPQSKFWGFLPSLNISSPLGCLLCADHLGSSADVVVGDAWHPKFIRKDSKGVSIVIARTPKGLRLIEAAFKDEALYIEEANLRDLLIAQGLHLIEGTEYTPIRQKTLQHRIIALHELSEIDKAIAVSLTIVNQQILKFKTIRQLLSTSPTEKILKIVLRLLSRKKRKRLSQVAQSLLTSNFAAE